MPRIIFVEHDGAEHVVDAEAGKTVMENAIRHGVPGIDADCGGSCSCATCHVYVDDAWVDQVGERGDMEVMMLEYAEHVGPTSRLSCQITVSEALAGVRLRLPVTQR